MWFKKKKFEKSNIILNLTWSIIVIFMLFLAAYTFEYINKINFWSKKVLTSETSTWKIIEKTVSTKKEINVLLLWRWGLWNDAPNLTDSIILAKINSNKKIVSLLSIQRDLYVNYPEKDWHWKINSVYSHYYQRYLNNNPLSKEYYKKSSEEQKKEERDRRKKAEIEWVNKLAEKIQEITWETVNFYINIDFNWFKKIIDAIWWVEIDVKHNIVDRTYPTNDWWYQTVSFQKWVQIMNWDLALKYARSRHSTSDFDRSLRQQQIIEGVKNRIKNINIQEALRLYQIFSEYLSTDFSIEDIKWILLNYDILQENYTFISSNFNDTCYSSTSECEKWGILYTPNRELFNWQWISLINGSTPNYLSQYEVSKKYSNIVLNFPLIEKENLEINIFNWAWWTWIAWSFVNELRKYWFQITRANIFNAPEKVEKSIIYYNGISETDSDSINALKNLFTWEVIKTAEPKYPINGKNLENENKAKIEIIIWKDYLLDKKIFNF